MSNRHSRKGTRTNENEALKQQIAEMQEKLEAMEAKQFKNRVKALYSKVSEKTVSFGQKAKDFNEKVGNFVQTQVQTATNAVNQTFEYTKAYVEDKITDAQAYMYELHDEGKTEAEKERNAKLDQSLDKRNAKEKKAFAKDYEEFWQMALFEQDVKEIEVQEAKDQTLKNFKKAEKQFEKEQKPSKAKEFIQKGRDLGTVAMRKAKTATKMVDDIIKASPDKEKIMAYTKEFENGFKIKNLKEEYALADFEKQLQNSPDGKVKPMEKEDFNMALYEERAKANMDEKSLEKYEIKKAANLGEKKAQREAYAEAAAPVAKAMKKNAAAVGNLVMSKIRKVAEKFGVVDKKQEVSKEKSSDLEM